VLMLMLVWQPPATFYLSTLAGCTLLLYLLLASGADHYAAQVYTLIIHYTPSSRKHTHSLPVLLPVACSGTEVMRASPCARSLRRLRLGLGPRVLQCHCSWRGVHDFSRPAPNGVAVGLSKDVAKGPAKASTAIGALYAAMSNRAFPPAPGAGLPAAVLLQQRILQKQCSMAQLQCIADRLKLTNTNSTTIENLVDACFCAQFVNSEGDSYAVLALVDAWVAQLGAMLQRDPSLSFRASYIASVAISIKSVKKDSLALGRILVFVKEQVIRCSRACYFMKEKNICKILYGLQGLGCDIPEVSSLLSTLIRTSFSQEREKIRPRFIGMALYGLHGMTADTPQVRAVLSYLAPRIVSCPEEFNGYIIGMSMYGVRMMRGDVPEVSIMLSALASKIANSKQTFNIAEVSTAIGGLQGMTGQDAAAVDILANLVPKISNCTGEFSKNQIAMLFSGLKNMSSNTVEVRALLAEIVPRLRSSTFQMDSHMISGTMFGLRYMSSDASEVCAVLDALVSKVEKCSGLLSADCAAWAVHGFQEMRGDKPEVLALLSAISRLIDISNISLVGRQVGLSFYGLKSLNSGSVEVRDLLTILTKNIAVDCRLTASEIAMALFGFRHMRSDVPEVCAALRRLTPLVKTCADQLTSQEVGMALHGFSAMSSDAPEVRSLLSILSELILASKVRMETESLSNAVQGIRGMDYGLVEMKQIFASMSTSAAEVRTVMHKIDSIQ
jgi:hypothetical protein